MSVLERMVKEHVLVKIGVGDWGRSLYCRGWWVESLLKKIGAETVLKRMVDSVPLRMGGRKFGWRRV